MSTYFPIVIYHNPECGTSCNVLAMIEAAGYQPEIIDYQATGWTHGQLLGLFAAAGLTPSQALRDTKSPAAELGLLDGTVSNTTILQAMVTHPILVNRPIVATPKGVRLCRPSKNVLDLLETLPLGQIQEGDGALSDDETGARIG